MKDEILYLYSEIKSNNNNEDRCFECRMLYPNYISSNNGIFLCFLCASYHKDNLSEKYSNIIEINLCNKDKLRDYINYMFVGGNQRLKDFYKGYDLLVEETDDNFSDKFIVIDKYITVAADYYRVLLDNETRGITEIENLPDFEKGRRKNNPEIKIQKINDTKNNDNYDYNRI